MICLFSPSNTASRVTHVSNPWPSTEMALLLEMKHVQYKEVYSGLSRFSSQCGHPYGAIEAGRKPFFCLSLSERLFESELY